MWLPVLAGLGALLACLSVNADDKKDDKKDE
jgi:hypothetical protein